MNEYLDINPEVREGRWRPAGRSFGAGEHHPEPLGMPRPENLDFRRAGRGGRPRRGRRPATMAIVGGKLKVGLSQADLGGRNAGPRAWARSAGATCRCTGARAGTAPLDLATTMLISALAGVRVFATGVRRRTQARRGHNGSSADLQELAHTSVAVVCAGPGNPGHRPDPRIPRDYGRPP